MTDERQTQARATGGEADFSPSTVQGPAHVEGLQNSPLDIKALAAVHKHRQEARQLDHDLEEARQDNDARRRREWIIFVLVAGGMAVGFLVGCGLMVFAADQGNREFGRALVLLVVGALGGYFSAKRAQ